MKYYNDENIPKSFDSIIIIIYIIYNSDIIK